MTDPNQPREYDAVLGGENQIPIGAAVLGGIAGVKRRFVSADVEARIAAVKDAPKYGQAGLDLVMQALQDSSDRVQRAAYLILRERTEPQVRQVLKEYIPYKLFDCIRTVKVGTNIAISPDGTRTASLQGKSIKVGNLDTNELLYTIDKYPRAKESFALGTDEDFFVRSRDNTIEIWENGELGHTLRGHEGEIHAIALSPDSKIIASGSQDNTIKLWNLNTGKLICTFGSYLTWGAHKAPISCLAFSPDGQTLASSSHDATIKLWDLRTRDRPPTIKRYASCLAFSPDGKTLASASIDRKIRLWSLSGGELAIAFEEHSSWINAIAFSPDGRTLASASGDRTVKLWNANTGQEIRTLTAHQDAVTCLAFSGNGETLISGSLDKTLKLWGVS